MKAIKIIILIIGVLVILFPIAGFLLGMFNPEIKTNPENLPFYSCITECVDTINNGQAVAGIIPDSSTSIEDQCSSLCYLR